MFPLPIHLLRLAPLVLTAFCADAALLPHRALAQHSPPQGAAPASSAAISAAAIEGAEYHSGDLPAGQSAITAKVQILLDRSGISPGVVDGWRGGMSESALKAFQRRAGLPMDGRMSPVVWQLLQPFAAEPLTMEYTITEEDSYGLVDNIPADYGEKAKMTSQGYTSIAEKLAERFHMDEKFLLRLNPGVELVPGATIKATVPARPIRARVARIIVDKSTRRVAAYDANGRMVADYPATVGSDQTPSPHGTHVVDAVALDPVYTYNPSKNFKQGNNDRVLVIPPGPNGPVGNVWIDLSKPTYGIHGTATPSRLFVNQSNGCVRLTNWDARELAGMVQSGRTVVEFLDPGVSIADVTGTNAGPTGVAAAVTTIAATRPPARPQHLGPAAPQIAAEQATVPAAPTGQDAPPAAGAPSATPPTTALPSVVEPARTQQPAAPSPAVPNAPDALATAIAEAAGPEGIPASPPAATPDSSAVTASPLPAAVAPAATVAPSTALAPTAPPRRRLPANPAATAQPVGVPATGGN